MNDHFLDLTDKANQGDEKAIQTLLLEYAHEKEQFLTYDDQLISVCQQKKPYSLYLYAKMHALGWGGVPLDGEKCTALLLESAELGCSQALVCLADMVLIGYHKADIDQLYNDACAQNNPSAYEWRARQALDQGRLDDFFNDCRKASDLGNSNGHHEIGQYYHDEGNFKQAMIFYRQAIKMENSHSMLNMASMYILGEGCKRNTKKAQELLKRSEALKNVKATVSLGALYQELGDDEKAKEQYQKAAQEDDPLAYYNLGLLFDQEDERVEAVKMFLKSARLNHPSSIQKLINWGIDPKMQDEDVEKVVVERETFHQTFSNFGAYDGNW